MYQFTPVFLYWFCLTPIEWYKWDIRVPSISSFMFVNTCYVYSAAPMGLQSLSCVWLFPTPWTAAHQAPLSMGFSRQEYWSGLPFSLFSHRCFGTTGVILQTSWKVLRFTRGSCSVQFSSVQLLSHVPFFATPWIAACQDFLSITNSRNLLKLMHIE